ncbi:MAG: CPBP family intramembrane metalloprotease [Flavobacteriales bacterium]|jgi:membrane protease YdiL (CAAX protease family)|nr:CPBP family intramembrane metalloprotease [Flavobacteriales bacterium]MBK7248929.1 CPBP family intramembrane metalloprotease [Flavobacteriales bacterium]MBK9058831.1 CPBP family intramembrane metalloprotease [Flavobacteriales bacterium]MBK9600039.1 CPBP family intramembrane metalloprotease [Flavobacteriales bacterium]QQS71182.1 MAG: CPBP family intramembrane metalloprotease [Flavobacteriales bacterium]
MRAFITRFPVLSFTVLTLGYQFLMVGFMSYRLHDGLRMEDDPVAHMVFRFRVFGPLGFAMLISYYLQGSDGLKTLFGSYFRWKAPTRFYALAISWKFLYFYAGIIVITLLGLAPWPGWVIEDFFGGTKQAAINLMHNFAFIVGIAFVEETAWMKFSVTRLQGRFSALASCAIVGVSWGLWYLPMLLLGEGVPDGFPVPVFMASMFSLTILLGWIFNMTRSGTTLMIAQIVSNCAFFIVPVFPANGGLDPIYINGFVVANCIGSALLVLIYGWRELGTRKRAVWGEERSTAPLPVLQPLPITRGTLK